MFNRGPLFIIIAAILWSIDGVLRRNLYSLPPATIVFLEHAIGFMVLLPVFLRTRIQVRALRARTWLSIVAIALFGGFVGTLAYTSALGKVQYIDFSVVVLLQQLQPVFAIALAALVLKERLNREFIALALLALGAAYFVSFPDLAVNLRTGAATAGAASLALLAALCWGASTVLGRHALKRVSFISLSGLRFLITGLCAFIYVAATQEVGSIGALTATQWWYVIAIVFSTGLVALLIYYHGLSRVPARVSTLLELVWPLSALCIDVVYFGTRLSGTQWIGVAVLLYVIVTISRRYGATRDYVLQRETA